MKIKHGTHRIVIVNRYFTIKFPRIINPHLIVSNFSLRRLNVAIFDIKQMLLVFKMGFKENLNEFLCWIENRAGFLTPVYFSIGIIEIQKTSHLREISENEAARIWEFLIKLVGNEVWETDSHNLASRLNYHKEGNQFKLIDYGGRNMRRFIKKHRKELEEVFSTRII